MRQRRFSRNICCRAFTVALCLAGASWASGTLAAAQQLSIRHYDVSNGLAHSHVSAIHQDAKGYLWLATWEGLSRFDGYRFSNYDPRDGLGDPIINAIAEDAAGHLWVGTNGGGVARLVDDPRSPSSDTSTPRPKFNSFRVGDSSLSNRVNALVFDSQNNLWCATDGGLYRAAAGQEADLKFEAVVSEPVEMDAAFADSRGRLWFGMPNALLEIAQGQIIKYESADTDVARHTIKDITEDRQGRLLVANEREIFEFEPPSDDSQRGQWRRLQLSFTPHQGIHAIASGRDDTLWVGTWDGLVKYRDGQQTTYTSVQGLSDNDVRSLTEDRDGNLWIGTVGGGVCKLSGELIVTFTKNEGLPDQDVGKVFQDSAGNMYASIRGAGVVRIEGGKVVPLSGSQQLPLSDLNERVAQDKNGDWWVGTGDGLFRFPGPGLQLRRGQHFTPADGLPEGDIQGGLYEDPNGRIWVSPFGSGLYYIDPAPHAPARFQFIPESNVSIPSVLRMVSDHAGTLWLGADRRLGRLINGRVALLRATDGLPETNPRSFFVDSRGWLWVGLRYGGVSVTRDPDADSPAFTNYSSSNGLASDAVWTIAEDDLGRMYFGTGKGLDQLDLSTNRIRHFNTDDGLAGDVVNYCFKDREGYLWVGTTLGLSRLNPRAEQPADQPPPIYLSRINIAGEELPLPETGTSGVPTLELASSRNNLLIEYVALSFRGEDKLRYQYKLEGIDEDWSPPTDVKAISYARLAPGSYHFLVRALNQEGVASADAATFQFRILRPVWQRWWFLTAVALLTAALVYAAHRQRVARSIELERVRTRIATDLHDDIGANLSLIAMLSEVARGQLSRDDQRLKEWFSTIASTSRDTVDSMSDIVWAVNPKRDHLSDLTRRMRRFADDILAARNIELRFRAPDDNLDLKIGADLRREIFLIFKETINNVVRHSHCTTAEVDLEIARGNLILRVSDDGRGLSAQTAADGTGLASLSGRAEKLGGTFEIASSNGAGLTVILNVPLGPRARL
jgi:ligand-binding sensor domain-containing protein/signal transduction histidine kinase